MWSAGQRRFIYICVTYLLFGVTSYVIELETSQTELVISAYITSLSIEPKVFDPISPRLIKLVPFLSQIGAFLRRTTDDK